MIHIMDMFNIFSTVRGQIINKNQNKKFFTRSLSLPIASNSPSNGYG